jgi:hypothetical protein
MTRNPVLVLAISLLGVLGMVERPPDRTEMREFPKQAMAETKRLGGAVTVVKGELVGVNLIFTRATDATLATFKGLTTLRELGLTRTQVTDAGLANLKGMANLRRLDLWDTNVTDTGLARLRGLVNLRTLYLGGKMTDAGLAHLEGLKNLLELNLKATHVTDAGLKYFKGLTNLRTLYLEGTKVTDKGVNQLQKALPEVEIQR